VAVNLPTTRLCNDTATGELLETYGVSDHLYKPFEPEVLLARVKALLLR
jgi:DNA-binding response OmpR family regulator